MRLVEPEGDIIFFNSICPIFYMFLFLYSFIDRGWKGSLYPDRGQITLIG
jgi:hypothetical protein